MDDPAPPRPAHHTPRGFRNPPGSPTRHGAATALTVARYLWRTRHVDKRPPVPEGFVLSKRETLAGYEAAAGSDSVTWLGHAAFLIRLGGRTLLTDPFLGDYASPVEGFGPKRFSPPALRAGELPPLDALLLSHDHYDHLDTRSLTQLNERRALRAIVPLGLASSMHELGFTDVVEIDWDHRIEMGAAGNAALRVTAAPVVHFSGRGLFDRNRTLWCGYVVESGGRRVFFGGDSADGAVFDAIGAKHGPFDLAILGIGAYEPRDLFRHAHANPEEAADMGRRLGARRVLGMHYGAVVLSAEPPFEPPVRFRAAARSQGYADADIWLPRVGETLVLD